MLAASTRTPEVLIVTLFAHACRCVCVRLPLAFFRMQSSSWQSSSRQSTAWQSTACDCAADDACRSEAPTRSNRSFKPHAAFVCPWRYAFFINGVQVHETFV
eukprot:364515-Chlamydomonas_euryale.AAC.3